MNVYAVTWSDWEEYWIQDDKVYLNLGDAALRLEELNAGRQLEIDYVREKVKNPKWEPSGDWAIETLEVVE